MNRRLPCGGAWRWIIAAVLLIGTLGAVPVQVQAQAQAQTESTSTFIISTTDDTGSPVVGAEYSVFDAVPDEDDAELMVSGEMLVAGPVLTAGNGVAVVENLPDGEELAVVQTSVPPGYLADPVAEQIVTTDPDAATEVAFVNAAIQDDPSGEVEVGVADSDTGELVPGVSVQIYARNPDTGGRGISLEVRTTGLDGYAVFDLLPGSYVVALVDVPVTYLPPGDDQVVTVGPPIDGTPDFVFVSFTVTPDTSQSPTNPSEPTAPPPDPPAMIVIESLVCTTTTPEVVGTVVISPDAAIGYFGDALPEECRPAADGEFAYRLYDPRDPENDFDDISLGQAMTDDDGYAAFTVPIADTSGTVYAVADDNPASSPYFTIASEVTTPVLAVHFTGVPRGDLRVTTTDAVTTQAVGGCYMLAAAGAESVPIADACDGDDDTEDGVVTFPDLANGAYVVIPSWVAANYVAAPSAPAMIAGADVELAMIATPYGTLEAFAFACTVEFLAQSGVIDYATPAPAAGDSFDTFAPGSGDDADRDDTPPLADVPPVLFSAQSGSDRPSNDGTGIGLAADPALSAGCVAAVADLEIVPPGEDAAALAFPVSDSGFGATLALPPIATDDPGYRVRDRVTGLEVEVALAPAAITTVTVAFPIAADTTTTATTTDTGDLESATTGVPDAATVADPGSERLGVPAYTTDADRAKLSTVTVLPATGAGAPPFTAGNGTTWPLITILTLIMAAIALRPKPTASS